MSVSLPFLTAYLIRYILLFQLTQIIWEEMYHQHYYVSTTTWRIVRHLKTGVKSAIDFHSQSSVRSIPTASQECFILYPHSKVVANSHWFVGSKTRQFHISSAGNSLMLNFKCIHIKRLFVQVFPLMEGPPPVILVLHCFTEVVFPELVFTF